MFELFISAGTCGLGIYFKSFLRWYKIYTADIGIVLSFLNIKLFKTAMFFVILYPLINN